MVNATNGNPADDKVAAWQSRTLWNDTQILAEVEQGRGSARWCVTFPSSSPLITRDNESSLLAGAEQHDSFWDARRYASGLARAQGYRIVSNKAGLARFKAAQSRKA
jgi:hypothetical protein